MKETLEFNHKKQCGLWLVLIGIVLIYVPRYTSLSSLHC